MTDWCDWDAGLREQYSDMFAERYRNETPEGWMNIISTMFSDFSKVSDPPKIAQIKEKFGGLRVYTNSFDSEQVREIIQEAEVKCDRTCDICGEAGELVVSHCVYKVVCSVHSNFMTERLR